MKALFQEDNIFGTNASLTYGPQLHIYVWENATYLQYVQSRWGLRTPSLLRAGYPTLLNWRGRYDLSKHAVDYLDKLFSRAGRDIQITQGTCI